MFTNVVVDDAPQVLEKQWRVELGLRDCYSRGTGHALITGLDYIPV